MSLAEREYRDSETKALFELAASSPRPSCGPRRPRRSATASSRAMPSGCSARPACSSLPYPERFGGGGQPFETYLQVVEELAGAWLAVGLGLSVHTLTCHPLVTAGTPEQQERWLPGMLGGDQLGAYCLSEPASGSDAAALRTMAQADGPDFILNGVKAWISHAGQADFYTVFARTSGDPASSDRARGISCLHVPAQTPGVQAAPAEHKMGMRASVTAQVIFEDARVPAANLIGGEGNGFGLALAALDAGRLGIAACATGLAQAALSAAVAFAGQRRQFGQRIGDFQGISFLLADMATAVAAARALYLSGARRKDAGLPYGPQAAMAKLFASDAAMRVTTDAVQVLGGYGYVEDFPAERYLREAKALQIVEGTNQIQRLVIGRAVMRGA